MSIGSNHPSKTGLLPPYYIFQPWIRNPSSPEMKNDALDALKACAYELQVGNMDRADYCMKSALYIAEKESHEWDTRFVFYFAEALARRAFGLHPKFSCLLEQAREPMSFSFHFDLIARDAIEEAIVGKRKVHLIDISGFESDHMASILTEIYFPDGVKKPFIKLSHVIQSSHGTGGSLASTGNESNLKHYLLEMAYESQVERKTIKTTSFADIDVSELKIEDDEFVVLYSSFVSMLLDAAALDKLLKTLRNVIKPDVMIMVEHFADRDDQSDNFLQRFHDSLQYYSSIFSTYGSEDGWEPLIRYEISNAVACEGSARVGRRLTLDRWRHLLNKSGFSPILEILDEEQICILEKPFVYKDGFVGMRTDDNRHPFTFVSAWKTKGEQVMQSSFDEELDFGPIPSNGDVQNNSISLCPKASLYPKNHTLIRMASLAEISDISQDIMENYHHSVRLSLTWASCERISHDCLPPTSHFCIADFRNYTRPLLGFPLRFGYHPPLDHHVPKTLESNRPLYKPMKTDEFQYLGGHYFTKDMDGALAIKLCNLHGYGGAYVLELFLMSDNDSSKTLLQRKELMENILCYLKNKKSSFVAYQGPTTISDLVPSVQLHHEQGALAEPHDSVTRKSNHLAPSKCFKLNAETFSDRKNQTPRLGPETTPHQKDKKRRKEFKNKSKIWDHVEREEDKHGTIWVKCKYCRFAREDCSKKGTTVWKNHFLRKHRDEWAQNVDKSSKLTIPPTSTTQMTEKFKDAGSGSGSGSSPGSGVRTNVIGMSNVANHEKEVSLPDISMEAEAKPVKKIKRSRPENLFRAVSITNDEWIEGSKQWDNALVGYVLGLKPTLEELECFAKREWTEFQVPKISILRDEIFLFDFESAEMKRVIWESQWTYKHHLLVLRQWTPELDLDNLEVSRKVPIWVKFPKLHLSLWNPICFEKLASCFGTHLATDKATTSRKQLQYARMLVEVELDTMDTLPSAIPVNLPSGSFQQPVVFEWSIHHKENNSNFLGSSHECDGMVARGEVMKKPRSTWSEENVKVSLIYPFTLEDYMILDTWRDRNITGEIIITVGVDIKRIGVDIKDTYLAPLIWPPNHTLVKNAPEMYYIHDTVIDAFFHLLKERSDRFPDMYSKHYSFSCFIAAKLLQGQAKDVSTWFDFKDLIGVSKLFMPVCLPRLRHWVLFYVNIEDRQLLWLDSYKVFQKSHEYEMRGISEWFIGYLLPKLGHKDANNWEVKVQEDIPTQENAIDCGIFVMKYADCLIHGDYFPFSQEDMPHFRRRIFLDIYNGEIHVPQQFIKSN